MADDKQFAPTARRIEQARSKGQVARTRELGPALAFLAVAVAATIAGADPWLRPLRAVWSRVDDAGRVDFGVPEVWAWFATTTVLWLPATFVLLGAAAGGGFLGMMLQGGPHPSAEPLQIDPSKLSPAKKLKSMFALKNGWETVRAIISASIIIWIVTAAVRRIATELVPLTFLGSAAIGVRFGELVIGVAWRAGLGLTVLAALDLFIAKLLYVRELRMSRQEMKEEAKESEGNPEVKAGRKKRMFELLRSSSIASVPRADVVVTNPTHYAVALSYRRATMAAPRVVAKGRNRMALRIRSEAQRHGVPLFESPELARELYAKVSVDREIPQELFLAVAEVIAFVMRVNQTVGADGEAEVR